MARPTSWGPPWLLAWVLGNPGASLLKQLQTWTQEWDLPRGELARDVRLWRKTVPGFGEALKTAGVAPVKPRGTGLGDGWRERFIAYYSGEQGPEYKLNRKAAAEAAGLRWATIRGKLNERAETFDPVLAEMVREVEAETAELGRGGINLGLSVLTKAALSADVKAADALVRHSVNVMERLEPQQWSRHQTVHFQGTVYHAPAPVRAGALGKALEVSRAAVALPLAPAEPLSLQTVEAQLLPEEGTSHVR